MEEVGLRLFNLYGTEVLSIIRTSYEECSTFIHQDTNIGQAPITAPITVGPILTELLLENLPEIENPPPAVENPPPKKRGRPLGSKNRPKVGAPNKRAHINKQNVAPS